MKNKKMKNKLIILAVILIIAITAAVIIVVSLNNEEIINGENNNPINQNIKVTGKLAEYINGLTDNYYIKYSGNFKNSSGESKAAIVEYTKSGENYALRASELDIQLICESDKLYSVSRTYKMIVQMNKQSFDISEYNLASDIGQTFVKSYKESVNSTEYDVEEYTVNGKTLKYYFKGSDIKLIRYDSETINVLRLEKKTNNELFVKPEGYSNV